MCPRSGAASRFGLTAALLLLLATCITGVVGSLTSQNVHSRAIDHVPTSPDTDADAARAQLSLSAIADDAPAVAIAGDLEITVRTDRATAIDTTLVFKSDLMSSLASVTRASYMWALQSGPSGESVSFEPTGPSLILPAYSLRPSATPYNFTVTLTVFTSSTASASSFASVSITATRAPLVATVSPGGQATELRTGPHAGLTFSAADSRDLGAGATETEQTAMLAYAWSCTVAAIDADVVAPPPEPCFPPAATPATAPDASAVTYTLTPAHLAAIRRAHISFGGVGDGSSGGAGGVETRAEADITAIVTLTVTAPAAGAGVSASTSASTTLVIAPTGGDLLTVSAPAGVDIAAVSTAQPLELSARIALHPELFSSAAGSRAVSAEPLVLWTSVRGGLDLASASVAVQRSAVAAPVEPPSGLAAEPAAKAAADSAEFTHRLTLLTGVLAPGTEYAFRASLFPHGTDLVAAAAGARAIPFEGELASAVITLTADAPPAGGTCDFARSAMAATPGVPLVLACTGWTDASAPGAAAGPDAAAVPLMYRWLLLRPQTVGVVDTSVADAWVEISPASPVPSVSVALDGLCATGHHDTCTVAAVVSNARGASVTAQFSVQNALAAAAQSAAARAEPLQAAGAALLTTPARDVTAFSGAIALKSPGLVSQLCLRLLASLSPPGAGSTQVADATAVRLRIVQELSTASEALTASQRTRRASRGGAFLNAVLGAAGGSELAVELLAQVTGSSDHSMSPELRKLSLGVLFAHVGALVASDRATGITLATAHAALQTLSSVVRVYGRALSAAATAAPAFARSALLAELQAEARALSPAVHRLAGVAALGSFAVYAAGTAAKLVRAGAVAIATAAADTNESAYTQLNLTLTSGAFVRVRLPRRLPCLNTGSDASSWLNGLQAVVSAVDDTSVLTLAGLTSAGDNAETPSEVLARVVSSPVVSLTLYDRASTALESVPLLLLPGTPAVAVPARLRADLAACVGASPEELMTGTRASEGLYFELEVPHDPAPADADSRNDNEPRWRDATLSCEWWDPVSADWRGDGCVRTTTAASDDASTCRCTHLTSFRVLRRLPTVNVPAFLRLTPENVRKHPVPLIAIMVWFAVFLVFFYIGTLVDRRKDAEALRIYHTEWREATPIELAAVLLAPASGSFVSRDLRPGFAPGLAGSTESKSGSALAPTVAAGSPPETFRQRLTRIYKYSIRHYHIWSSIFLRDCTHPFSSVGRVTTAFVLVLTGYMVNAAFFGSPPKRTATLSSLILVVLSTLITVSATLVISILFSRSQRGRLKFAIYGYAEHLAYLEYTGRVADPAYRTRSEHHLRVNPAVWEEREALMEQMARAGGWKRRHDNQRVPAAERTHRDSPELRRLLRLVVDVNYNHLLLYHQRRFRFPSGYRLLGFVVIWIWVAVCAVLILAYGIQLDYNKRGNTTRWLRASAISTAIAIFVMKPIVIAVRALIVAACQQLCCPMCCAAMTGTSDSQPDAHLGPAAAPPSGDADKTTGEHGGATDAPPDNGEVLVEVLPLPFTHGYEPVCPPELTVPEVELTIIVPPTTAATGTGAANSPPTDTTNPATHSAPVHLAETPQSLPLSP